MKKRILDLFVVYLAIVSLLLQTISPVFSLSTIANAEETTNTESAPVVGSTTPDNTSTQVTESPEQTTNPEVQTTPAVTTSENVTPIPTIVETEVTPVANQTETPSTPAPNENSPPAENNSVSPSSASLTPQSDTQEPTGNEDINMIILENVSAPSIDLGVIEPENSATLTTDKGDYAPTDTALITGTGLNPDTIYKLRVWSDDAPATSKETDVTSSSEGTFVYAYQLDGVYRPNYSAELKDGEGTVVATVTFTDSDTGFKVPSSTHSNTGWDTNTISNIQSSNDVYATDNDEDRQDWSNFGFPIIPAGATIDGIEVKIEAKSSDITGCRLETTLSWDNGSSDSNELTAAITGTDTIYTFGSGATETWGRTWSNEDFTNANFVMKVRVDDVSGNDCSNGAIASIDHIQAKVYYTEAVADATSPTVTINQAGGQVDPTSTSPINFTVVFSESVSNFTTGDVTLGGTAGATTATVTGSGTTYNVAVSGMTGSGTVTASVEAGKATDAAGNPNTASTSTDNSVTYNNSNVSNPALPQACGLDIALILDNSTSIDSGELTSMKAAMNAFTNAFNGTPTWFSVSRFATTATVIQTFTNNLGNVNNAINSVPVGGGFTNWEDGLLKGQSTLTNRVDHPDLVIFASDGNPNRVDNGTSVGETQAVEEAQLVANSIKSGGARILALGIGNELNTANLQAISGPNVNTGITSDVITSNFSTLAEDLAEYAIQLCGGTVTVNKQVDTNGDNQYEGGNTEANNLGFDWGLDAETPTRDMGTNEANVSAGNHTISENSVAGYSFTGWYASNDTQHSCTNPTGTTLPVNITTSDNVITAITLCNKISNGTIVVHKDVQGPNGENVIDSSNNFTVQLDGANSQVLTDGGTYTYNNVSAGNHTITETVIPSSYSIYGISTSTGQAGNTGGLQVNVGGGQTVHVYVTNRQKVATIVVQKVVKDAAGNDTDDNHAFTVQLNNSNAVNTLAENNNVTYNNINPGGPYTVSETTDPNYDNLGCKLPNQDSATNFNLSPNQSITVTCTNQQKPSSISGYKYKSDGVTGILGWTIKLYSCVSNGTDCNTLVDTALTDATGFYSFTDLVVGFYKVIENLVDGFTPVSTDFHNVTINPNTQSTENNFSNFKNVSVTACKKVDADGSLNTSNDQTNKSGWTVNLLTDGQVTDSQVTGVNGCYTWTNLGPNHTYEVSENVPTGWTALTATQSSFGPVADGVNNSFTFINSQLGTIIVKKAMIGGTSSFGFTGDVAGTINANNGIISVSNKLPGTYTSVESNKTGWSLDSIMCNDTTNGGTASTGDVNTRTATFNLNSGETVTCTFTNKRDTGTIKIVKDAQPNSEDDFSFDTSSGFPGGDFELEDDGNDNNGGVEESKTVSVPTGQYWVEEDGETGWALTNLVCNDQNSTVNLQTGRATINVEKDETVTCTFTNKKLSTLIIKKDATPNSEENFSFTRSFGGGFELEDDGNDNNGGTEESVSFNNLTPGNYTVTENNKSGWTLTDIVCSDQTQPNLQGKNVTVSLDYGETVTCTFKNLQLGRIYGEKYNDKNGNNNDDSNEEDLSGWTIFIDENSNSTLDDGETSTTTNSGGDYSFENLLPGDYRICEVQKTGWYSSLPNQATCQSTTINSNGGDEDEVSFGNREFGSIRVCKVIVDSEGNLVNGSELPGVNFQINWTGGNGLTPTIFTSGYTPNAQIFSDSEGNDAYCTTYADIPLDNYGYSQEIISESSWETPKYNDQFDTSVMNLNDFYAYQEPGNENANGYMDLTNQAGPNRTLVILNQYKNGSVGGYKWNDLNGNGIRDCDILDQYNDERLFSKDINFCENYTEPTLSGWTIELYKQDEGWEKVSSTTTDENGNYTFSDILPGEYKVCEVLQNGWEQTYPNFDSQDQYCHIITVGSNNNENNINFGNHNITPVLNISKLNNATTTKVIGDSVEYTIIVTLDEEGGPAKNVELTDLPPTGFKYQGGSWSASKNGSPISISEPTYASPGQWQVGDMNPGDEVVLKYNAVIQSDVTNGTYYDIALAMGNPISDEETDIYAIAVSPGDIDPGTESNFVGTDVTVTSSSTESTSFEATQTQEVLGASTMLPATGTPTQLVVIGFITLSIGILSIATGLILRRKYE